MLSKVDDASCMKHSWCIQTHQTIHLPILATFAKCFDRPFLKEVRGGVCCRYVCTSILFSFCSLAQIKHLKKTATFSIIMMSNINVIASKGIFISFFLNLNVRVKILSFKSTYNICNYFLTSWHFKLYACSNRLLRKEDQPLSLKIF